MLEMSPSDEMKIVSGIADATYHSLSNDSKRVYINFAGLAKCNALRIFELINYAAADNDGMYFCTPRNDITMHDIVNAMTHDIWFHWHERFGAFIMYYDDQIYCEYIQVLLSIYKVILSPFICDSHICALPAGSNRVIIIQNNISEESAFSACVFDNLENAFNYADIINMMFENVIIETEVYGNESQIQFQVGLNAAKYRHEINELLLCCSPIMLNMMTRIYHARHKVLNFNAGFLSLANDNSQDEYAARLDLC